MSHHMTLLCRLEKTDAPKDNEIAELKLRLIAGQPLFKEHMNSCVCGVNVMGVRLTDMAKGRYHAVCLDCCRSALYTGETKV